MYRISSNKHILYGIVGFNYGWNKRSVTEPDTSIDKEYDMFLLFLILLCKANSKFWEPAVSYIKIKVSFNDLKKKRFSKVKFAAN